MIDNTFRHLTENQLGRLYNNFVVYRDRACNGFSDLSIYEFFNKYGLNSHESN